MNRIWVCLEASRIYRLRFSSRAMRLTVDDKSPLSSCSHMRMTVQPRDLSSSLTLISRVLFWRNLAFQNCLLVFGNVACSGQPCQKHPSTKIATRFPGNTRSGCPGNLYDNRYLNPAAQRAFRRRNSGLVSLRRTLAMQRLRCSGVKTSDIYLSAKTSALPISATRTELAALLLPRASLCFSWGDSSPLNMLDRKQDRSSRPCRGI